MTRPTAPGPRDPGRTDACGRPFNGTCSSRVVLSGQFRGPFRWVARRIGGIVIVAIVTLFYSGLLLAKSFLFRLALNLRSAVRPLTHPGAGSRHR